MTVDSLPYTLPDKILRPFEKLKKIIFCVEYCKHTLLKKFKGAHTLWQIAVKMDFPSFDTKIQKN